MHSHSQNKNLLKNVSIFALCVSVILILIKTTAYLISGSMIILSSLTDSFFDLFISIMNYVAILYSSRPKDDKYKFGYNAIEDIAGLAQTCFIIGSSFFIAIESVKNLIIKEKLEIDNTSIYVMILSIFLTLLVVLYQKYTLKRQRSLVIESDSVHFMSDLITNIGLLIALTVIKYTGFQQIDSIIGICVACYMSYSSFKIGKVAFGNLMSKELPDEMKNQILEIINLNKYVKGYHEFRTRRSGRSKFVQIHIDLDRNMNFEEAHEVSEEIEDEIQKKIGDIEIIIHKDPV